MQKDWFLWRLAECFAPRRLCSQPVCTNLRLCGQHGWENCSVAVLVARRAILFPGLAVGLAGWVSYFWMTHTHTHQTPCPLHHTLWDIIYDGPVTYGLFITQWQQHLSAQRYSMLSFALLVLICFSSSLSLFLIEDFFSSSFSCLLLFLFISLSQALTSQLVKLVKFLLLSATFTHKIKPSRTETST